MSAWLPVPGRSRAQPSVLQCWHRYCDEFTMRKYENENGKLACKDLGVWTAWTGSLRICSTKQPIDKGFGRPNFNMETTCFIISSPNIFVSVYECVPIQNRSPNIVYCVSVSMKILKSPTAQPAQPSQPHTFFIVDKT